VEFLQTGVGVFPLDGNIVQGHIKYIKDPSSIAAIATELGWEVRPAWTDCVLLL
jgi:hypothetical protein